MKALKELFEIGVIIFLLLVSPVIYLHYYPAADCDDKAVHYYSSAMFFADSVRSQTVYKTVPWFISLEPPAQRERLANRLFSASNYIMADGIINGVRSLSKLKCGPQGCHYSQVVKVS